MPVHIRPFVRGDRDQVAALVNAHVAAVVPNVSVSVQALMSQLEREPGEFIVDPWVVARSTLVAVQRDRVVAAAHLLRYGAGGQVGETYRGTGEIRWLVWWPPAPFWPDSTAAADALLDASLARLAAWQVTRVYADGTLPAPGVYGVPEQWPHVRDALHRAGFRGDRVECVHLARLDDLPPAGRPPIEGVHRVRSVGACGTRITAVLPASAGGREIGFVEVGTTLDGGIRFGRTSGLADVGNLQVEEGSRRRGVGTWLMGQARSWLELGGLTGLLAYTNRDDDHDGSTAAFLAATGFEVLTRTLRGLTLGSPGATRPDGLDRAR